MKHVSINTDNNKCPRPANGKKKKKKDVKCISVIKRKKIIYFENNWRLLGSLFMLFTENRVWCPDNVLQMFVYLRSVHVLVYGSINFNLAIKKINILARQHHLIEQLLCNCCYYCFWNNFCFSIAVRNIQRNKCLSIRFSSCCFF